MDFSDIFRIVNLGVGALQIVGGVTGFFTPFSIQHIVIAVYLLIFGAATVLLEFQIPPQISRYASFMFSFLGRGIFYILLGLIAVADRSWFWNLPGYLAALIGVAYVVLEFIPSIEPPANMRDADAGWGAEQV